MAKASGADPQWLSAPHSQIMVSQAGWPWGEHPWHVQTSQAGLGLTSQAGLGLTSQEGLVIDLCTGRRPTYK
jgi:hypothetical protein